jgi:hypothetical protein
MKHNPPMWAVFVTLLALLPVSVFAEERTERFDKDPGWDGHNNRAAAPRTVTQDFGYSKTNHTGSGPGEIGGFLSSAAEPAYYARKLPERTFDDPLTASGTLACDGRPCHALVGFFNAGTLNEWRTANTIALRISGRGDVFYAWVEYATSRWRAGGDDPRGFPTTKDPTTNRQRLKGFPAKGAPLRWSLSYDPKGNDGNGAITATVGEERAVCHLRLDHRADGATFNRFGLLNVMKHANTGGEIWLGDVAVNGDKEDLTKDPGWDQLQNRRNYASDDVRPRFDFGYSPTRHAGGQGQGELGGLVFRGDCRYEPTLAYYGDRFDELTLEKPLRASGRVSLKRGVTDSTTLIGFFHSQESVKVNPSQESGVPRSFLGAAVEGPSREGFFFYPIYRVNGDGSGHAGGGDRPRLLPDGAAHDWSLDYDPAGAEGKGRITIILDGRKVGLDLGAGHKATGARFDRFGIVTTWIDGNGQRVYFDDLTYTCKQE